MDKIDFKKKYKELYKPSAKTPAIVDVPALHYAILSGQGDPNTSQDFSNAITALYGLMYTISMSYKGDDLIIPDFYNFVVAPLEGVWDIAADKREKEFTKDDFIWTIGILLPDFIDERTFQKAKEFAVSKKKNNLINDISYSEYNDGLCCTMMHLGSYDTEEATFELMEQYANENGYIRSEKTHREIYLSDFRKVAPEKLKTVLRFKVSKK